MAFITRKQAVAEIVKIIKSSNERQGLSLKSISGKLKVKFNQAKPHEIRDSLLVAEKLNKVQKINGRYLVEGTGPKIKYARSKTKACKYKTKRARPPAKIPRARTKMRRRRQRLVRRKTGKHSNMQKSKRKPTVATRKKSYALKKVKSRSNLLSNNHSSSFKNVHQPVKLNEEKTKRNASQCGSLIPEDSPGDSSLKESNYSVKSTATDVAKKTVQFSDPVDKSVENIVPEEKRAPARGSGLYRCLVTGFWNFLVLPIVDPNCSTEIGQGDDEEDDRNSASSHRSNL